MPALNRLFLVLVILGLIFGMPKALGQGSRVRSLNDKSGESDQPQKRAQWRIRGRLAPPGESAAALRLRAFQQKMTMRAQRAAQAAQLGLPAQPASSGWVSLGPAPLASDATGTGFQDYGWVSGRATSVLIDPADATGNTVLLGGAYGGLWRATNAGNLSPDASQVVWQSLLDDQPTLAVGAIAVQPGNAKNGVSQVILVGTGETNSSGDSYYGLGILRSADGGNTWTQIAQDVSHNYSLLGVGFSKMAFSTANRNLVVASTADDIGLDLGLEQDGNSTARGLYWSSDAGQSWNRVILSDGAIPASVTGLIYNPIQGAFYAAVRRHGIYSSVDGQHFARLATQPTAGLASANCPANQNASSCQIYRAEFAVTPGLNEMYVWIVDYQSGEIDGGIWKTTNGGSSWTAIPDNGITNCGDPAGNGCGVQQGIYNLELAAVPNGAATDLYAGAVNLYKCTLTGGTSCSQGDWINLTHVYGCNPLSALAHIHPDQHGLALLAVNGKSPGYFAHDGGISRTLDGYSGLTTGNCTGTNQFDNLSQTLGSMTEFVSFSVHPTSADIMLGGTQDNGSPKAGTATSSTQWQNALSGDGGYNAINPGNPNEWFASNPDDSRIGFQIYKCELGTSCDDNGFTPIIDSATLGGDHAAFYPPYILDPQNASEMLVGTCRVWRVSTAGTAPLSLSYDFETGGTGVCTGDEVNLVALLAAGGPTDMSGNSQVVYATTYGYGPLSGLPGGGVWFTSSAGTTPMAYVTGPINPLGYTISAVAIDRTDTSGMTAFVGIRGFHASQVWLTRDGGAHWSDWTHGAGLPDVPVNTLLVASQAGKVYAGTDVGVFVSSTFLPSWSEVGPAPGPGVSGFLPNAPVTAMQLFNPNQSTKKLRVSTYGRGIWEYDILAPPDYANTISNSPQTVFPAQNATFNGTVTAAYGYNSLVDMSCSGAPPSTCTINPWQLTPTTHGSPYTVTAAGQVGDYNFAAHAVGEDPNHVVHDAAIALHVVDFALTAPNPSTVTVPQGLTGWTQFQVTAAGSFSQTVTLSCGGLPANASCSFAPSATVNPTAGNPVNVTVTVSAAANTPLGTSTVTIQGVTTGPAATRTTSFTLVVQAAPDFTWTASGSTVHHVLAGQSTLAYNFTATPPSGSTFWGDVILSCSFSPADPTLPNSSCSFNPAKIAAGSGATNVSMTITTAGPNQGVGGNRPGKKFGESNTSGRNRPGSPPISWLWLISLSIGGVVFASTSGRATSKNSVMTGLLVSLALIGLMIACGGGGNNAAPNPPPPQGAITVSVNPFSATVPLGGTQQFSAIVANSSNNSVTWSLSGSGTAGSSISGSGLLTIASSGDTPASFSVVATSQADTTKSGTSAVTIPVVGVGVSPPSAAVPLGGTQQFTASVTNSSDTAVTWTLNGTGATGSSISQSGMLTVAASAATPVNFSVVATSQADATQSGSSAATIPAVAVGVTPSGPINLYADETGNSWPASATQQQFAASVTNSPANQNVTWAVAGGNANGTIDQTGLYSAPATVPNPVTVAISATSQADVSKAGSGAVQILQPTAIRTFTVTVTATEGSNSHSQEVTLVVQ